MKKAINKFWGLLPFLIIIFCSILVAVIEKVTDNTFRILPRNIDMFRNNKYRNTTIMAKYTQKNICSSHIFVCTKNYISFSDWSCYLNWFVCYGIFTWSRTYCYKIWNKDGGECSQLFG